MIFWEKVLYFILAHPVFVNEEFCCIEINFKKLLKYQWRTYLPNAAGDSNLMLFKGFTVGWSIQKILSKLSRFKSLQLYSS
jgi:hypothetical protein